MPLSNARAEKRRKEKIRKRETEKKRKREKEKKRKGREVTQIFGP